jgi:Ger(x)C family germination protein
MAVAIDKNQPKAEEKRDFYEFTAQLTEARALSSQQNNPNVAPVWNVTTTAPSIFESIRLLATRVARPPYFDHLQVIIIGEELAKEGIDKALDLFYRDHESRPKIKLVIAKGKAKDALKVKPNLLPVSGQYISKLAEEGETKTARQPRVTTIGQFATHYHGGLNSVLPAIHLQQNEVKMAGGAIMKGDQLAGWLSDQDVKALRWVRGTFTAGDEVIAKDDHEKVMTFEVRGSKATVKTALKNGRPVFSLQIRGEGSLAEDGFDHNPTPEKWQEREAQFGRTIKQSVEDLITRMQKKQIDIFGFGEELRRHQYPYWRQHKEDWDNLFQHAEVQIEVKIYIRRIGQFT